MPILIPLTTGSTNFSLNQEFEGIPYTLRFLWRTRDGAWTMDVADDSGETVYDSGRRLSVDFPVNYNRTSSMQPRGAFVLTDSAGEGAEATVDSFGVRHLLYYYTTEELGLAPLPGTV